MIKYLQLITGTIIYIIGIITSFYPLYIISYMILGYDVIIKAITNIFKGELFDENFLMMIATLGALYIQEYKEAVAVMLFYQIGETLSDIAVDRSKDKIMQLMDLQSQTARVIRKGQIIEVNPNTVTKQEIILVEPGEKVPLDGVIIEGGSEVDMKSLTGESMPVYLHEKDNIISGSIILNKPLKIEVKNTLEDSTVTKMLNFIKDASTHKTKTEKMITRFAKIYTPIVCLLAFLLCFVPVVFFKGSFDFWFYKALIFLVISCPCALVISVPLGFFSGVGRASKEAILVKNTGILESMSQVKTILYDKTGTLTEGKFTVSKIVASEPFSKEEVALLAKVAEMHSHHPISEALINYCSKNINKDDIKDIEEKAGFGIVCTYQGQKLIVGNEKLLHSYQINIPRIKSLGTVILVAVDQKFAGYIVMNDELKKNSKKTINYLTSLGIEQVMLTGDRNQYAKKIARELNIDYYAELLPMDKEKLVEEYTKKQRDLVAFIGDGLNDAPALVASDVGISMGNMGSDAAIVASDIVIMDDNLKKVEVLLKISCYTRRKVIENIVLALAIKIIILLLGALGFVSIWLAVFADVGVTLLAVLNSLLVLRIKL